jgi:hypothetical protein
MLRYMHPRGAPLYYCREDQPRPLPQAICIEGHLTDMSDVSRLVLTTELKGVDHVAMGYKCNKRKVIHFIANARAANTLDGDDSYMQRRASKYGNICVRTVPRLALASEYFSKSPRVDNHNQLRQHDLALEELWQTHDC